MTGGTYGWFTAHGSPLGVFYTTDWQAGSVLASQRLIPVSTAEPVPDKGGIYAITPARDGMPSKTRALSACVP